MLRASLAGTSLSNMGVSEIRGTLFRGAYYNKDPTI